MYFSERQLYSHNRLRARRAAGVAAVLGQRRRQWDNIVPTLAGRFRVLLGRLWACAGALLGHRRRRWSSFWADFGSGFLLADACIARGCGHRTDVVLLLGRRPKRWPSSEAALGPGLPGDLLSIFSYVVPGGHDTLKRFWCGVGPAS